MVTQEDVLDQLKQVHDPEIPLNIVDLGLIYGIEIDGTEVSVTMSLTTMGCPVADHLQRHAEQVLRELKGIETVEIDITFDPPWTPEMVTEEGKQQLTSLGVM